MWCASSSRSDAHLYAFWFVTALVVACSVCRRLYERVVHCNFRPKTMKLFFKRYLAFEKAHGTPESIEAVKQKVKEYVEGSAAKEAAAAAGGAAPITVDDE